jgi:sugar lactone lactonase YvrE
MDQVLPSIKVAPDGGCLDSEGAWWLADATGSRVIRVAESGEILDEVHPGSPVCACGLGGADGRALYACVAPDFYEEARKAAREARLLAFRVAVPAA